MRLVFVALVAILAMTITVAAEQSGSLAAGASITVDTGPNADDLTEVVFKNDSDKEITVAMSGAATRSVKIGPVSTVGLLGKYKGAKLTIANMGPAPIEYKISW